MKKTEMKTCTSKYHHVIYYFVSNFVWLQLLALHSSQLADSRAGCAPRIPLFNLITKLVIYTSPRIQPTADWKYQIYINNVAADVYEVCPESI